MSLQDQLTQVLAFVYFNPNKTTEELLEIINKNHNYSEY